MNSTERVKIAAMRASHYSIPEMLAKLPNMTNGKLRSYLSATYGSSARLPRPWSDEDLEILISHSKLTPWQMVSKGIIVNKDPHEILTKLLELRIYDWILPKLSKEDLAIRLEASLMYHHCFPYELIEIDSGLSITTVVASYRQFKKYIPYFKSGKPRHQNGIEKRTREYTNKKPLF